MKLLHKKSAIRFSALWVLLLLPLSSFSYTFGYTPNVAISGLEWTMTPTYLGANGIGGMDVSGVTYKYTPIKNKEDEELERLVKSWIEPIVE